MKGGTPVNQHCILDKLFDELTNLSYDRDLLGEQTEQLKDILVQGILNQTISELFPSFQLEEQKLEAMEHLLEIFDKEEHQKIYYYTAIKTIAMIVQEAGTELKKQERYGTFFRYKYLVPVLDLLSQNRMMNQHRIAEHLNISSQSLSNFFRRTNDFGLWKKKMVDKNSFYIITAQGKEAYRYYKQAELTTTNIEQILTTAFSLLKHELKSSAPNPEHIIHTLNTKYGKKRSVFRSMELKSQIRQILNDNSINYDVESVILDYSRDIPEYDSDDYLLEMELFL